MRLVAIGAEDGAEDVYGGQRRVSLEAMKGARADR